LPVRLRRLFWILTVNGAVLACQGLMQRAEGGNKLLWLIVPRYDQEPETQFGPYAYRANAAQYFNLLWPAVLGFWWACVSSLRRRKSADSFTRRNRAAVLLPCVLIMAICPLVSTSRGGAIVLVINLVMAVGVLLMAQWRSHWTRKALILFFLAGVVGGGGVLGWKSLAPRMEMIHEGYEARQGLYLAGHYMARDNDVFGTGPGTFNTMYQLYGSHQPDEWLAYMHNDWLETLITFGRLGAAPVFLTLLLVLSHRFWGGGIYGNKYFVMLLWVSLGGCLVHACFDFPFQVHSVLALFLVLCAVLSCLSRRKAAAQF
jgi:O-antigen ligase